MKSFCTIFILLAFVFEASAQIFYIGFGAPQIGIRVGQPTGVSTVDVNVPVNNIGDGTPIVGTPAVFVGAYARAPFSFPYPVFTMSVDSSLPLSNGSETIPFTEISWTSAAGDIPSGTFTGGNSQVILGPIIAAFVVTDTHTFEYANTDLIASGSYTGRVTYTAAVP